MKTRYKYLLGLVVLSLVISSSGFYYYKLQNKSSADTSSNIPTITNYVGYHPGNIKKIAPFDNEKPIIVVNRSNYFERQNTNDVNKSLYEWDQFLPAIPIATWRDYYGKTQQIPIISLNQNSGEEGFRTNDFSSVYFLQQYKPTKIYVPQGSQLKATLSKSSLYGPNIPVTKIIEIPSLFSNPAYFWSSIADLVLVDSSFSVNDSFSSDYDQKYEDAILASSYASLLGAPLIVDQKGFDNVINDPNLSKTLKRITIIGKTTTELINYINTKKPTAVPIINKTSAELQKDIYAINKTNKFILIDPSGAFVYENDVLYNSDGSTYQANSDYKLMPDIVAMHASILAAGKQELIIPVHTNAIKFPNDREKAGKVNQEFRNTLSSLGITTQGSQYLTIMAYPDKIPQGLKETTRFDIQYSNGNHIAYYSNPEKYGGTQTQEELDNRLYGAYNNRTDQYSTPSRSWLTSAIRDTSHFVGLTVSNVGGWTGDGVEWIGERIGGDVGNFFDQAGKTITQGTTWLGGGIDFVTNAGLAFSQGMVGWIVRPGTMPDEIIVDTFINGAKKDFKIKQSNDRLNKNIPVHFKVGRIYGNGSDVSGYLARDLFYSYLPNISDQALSVVPGDDEAMEKFLRLPPDKIETKLKWYYEKYNHFEDYRLLFSTSKEYYGTTNSVQKRKEIFNEYQKSGLITYLDHGLTNGWKNILDVEAFYQANIKLAPSVVLTSACLLAYPENPDFNFAHENIRRGAMAVFAGLDVASGHRNFNDLFSVYNTNNDMGTAIKISKNKYNDGGLIEPMNFPNYNYVLIGDPTFKPTISRNNTYPTEFLSSDVVKVDPYSGIDEGIGGLKIYSYENRLPIVIGYRISDDIKNFNIQDHILSIELSITTLLGKEVRNISNLPTEIGENYLIWDGKDQSEKPVPNGTYLFNLKINYTDKYNSLPTTEKTYPNILTISKTFIDVDINSLKQYEYYQNSHSPYFNGPGLRIADVSVSPSDYIPTVLYFTPSTSVLATVKVYYEDVDNNKTYIRDIWQDKLTQTSKGAAVYWDGKDNSGYRIDYDQNYYFELTFKKPNGESFVDYSNNNTEYIFDKYVGKFSGRDYNFEQYMNGLNSSRSRIIDQTPPVMSNITNSTYKDSINIKWNTNEKTIRRVEYGLYEKYSDFVEDTELPTTSNSLTICNLQPSTTYHYRIISTDIWNNISKTADLTFKTKSSLDKNRNSNCN